MKKVKVSVQDSEMIYFYLCVCGTEGIAITPPDPLDGVIGMSIWRMGTVRLPFLHRLKHMWYTLRWGHPYVEDILLSPDDALALGKELELLALSVDQNLYNFV